MLQLLSLALQKTGDRDIAYELVQDSFISLYNHKNSAPEIKSVRAYLYVILKNNILNYYRKESARRKYQEYLLTFTSQLDNSTELSIESRELEKQLNDEIEKLPPKCRTVFNLSRREYLSNKEIAARLEISENTVEQHIRKALRTLRSSLGAFMEISVIIYLTSA